MRLGYTNISSKYAGFAYLHAKDYNALLAIQEDLNLGVVNVIEKSESS